MKIIAWLLLTLLLVMPAHTFAEDIIYTLLDEDGRILTRYCGECEIGDEYISQNNQHFRITQVNATSKTAKVQFIGQADMPDVSWLDMEDSQPVGAMGQRKIAIYCTHSDESYIKGDGRESVEGKGGIYDIAHPFGEKMESLGARVKISDQTHLPHDAGAYRRSRSTAVELLKDTPNAIFDIHRDGIPDPDEYMTTVGNEKMSMVRLLVGKSNQNKDANFSFAKQIKAVADKIYPGLIKDIYMGKGTYNQDLAPRSVLLEFGTHTIDKDLVLKAVDPMAESAYKALFGGVIGSAGTSDVRSSAKITETQTPDSPIVQSNKGTGTAIWVIVALIAGLAIFAFLSTGGKGGMQKFGRSFKEMTGGLLGKKPKDGE